MVSAIDDLIVQIENKVLRERLKIEADRITKEKKFGLVFEEHLPELTPLYNAEICPGIRVAKRGGDLTELWRVLSISEGQAVCMHHRRREKIKFPIDEIMAVANVGEPIFPTLAPIDRVQNGPDDAHWHTLIEADNYHALQLLEYLYTGQVDCIYIDPPYNTGARDWKYNNDYVDSNDSWRHSKWLAMMSRRLKIARRLLNPKTGVLIVTIDEHEIHHLGMLLENEFPEAYVQMATIVINQKGVSQGRLARTEEYAMYVFMPSAFLPVHHDDLLSQDAPNQTQVVPRWERLLRGGTDSRRADSPTLFYPIYVDPEKKKITGVGEILPLEQDPDLNLYIKKTVAWPIRTDGSFGRWQVSPPKFKELVDAGFARLGTYDKNRGTWTVLYLNRGTRRRIDDGEILITGVDPVTGVVNVEFANPEARLRNIKTVWHRRLHDSGIYGSSLLRTIIGDSSFMFPKSLYSTKDAIAAVVRDNPNALILDFFAGSGTTLNAVNLLNAIDGGQRRCILVTNNEISEGEARGLTGQGYQPGHPEWEKHGICQSITWPRSKYTILGRRDDGTEIDGEYFTGKLVEKEKPRSFFHIDFTSNAELTTAARKKRLVRIIEGIPQSLVKRDSAFILSNNERYFASVLFDDTQVDAWLDALVDHDHVTEFYIITEKAAIFNNIKDRISELLGSITVTEEEKRPIKDGFPANLEYFRMEFLERDRIALGRQFREILPLLWLRAGAIGPRPELSDSEPMPPMVVPGKNPFAVLVDETHFAGFLEVLETKERLTHVYLVTDSEEAFQEMASQIDAPYVFQLYRDYMDNFVINKGGE